MAEKSAEKLPVVLLDTNVVIEGAINLGANIRNSEAMIWLAFLEGKLRAAFSETLLLETLTVARRLMGKDFASKLRSQILSKAEILPAAEITPHVSQFSGLVPEEDIAHAALAAAVGAEYVISNNKDFLRSLGGKLGFKCVTPKSFIKLRGEMFGIDRGRISSFREEERLEDREG